MSEILRNPKNAKLLIHLFKLLRILSFFDSIKKRYRYDILVDNRFNILYIKSTRRLDTRMRFIYKLFELTLTKRVSERQHFLFVLSFSSGGTRFFLLPTFSINRRECQVSADNHSR